MMGYSNWIMHYIIGPKLPRISLRSVLQTTNEWCGHHIHLIRALFWLRGLFTCKILHLQISVILQASIKMIWLNISPDVFWSLVELVIPSCFLCLRWRDSYTILATFSITYAYQYLYVCVRQVYPWIIDDSVSYQIAV